MKNQNGNEEQVPKEIGSNITGTAVHAKPGHQRDIPIEKYIEVPHHDKSADASKHIENTDAILGDVQWPARNGNSADEHNAENEQDKGKISDD